MEDQISDAFTPVVQEKTLALPEDLEQPTEAEPTSNVAQRLPALAGAAVDVELGESDDPYQSFVDQLYMTSQQRDSKTGSTLIDAVTSELDPNDPEAVSIGVKVHEDAATPGINEKVGFPLVGDEEKLLAAQHVSKLVDHLEKNFEGLGLAKEYAKTIFIPLRDRFAAKAVFGTYDFDKVENIVNTFKASDVETQDKMLEEVFTNISKLDPEEYFLESMDLLDMLISERSDEDIQLMKFFGVLDITGVLSSAKAAPKIAAGLAQRLGRKTDLAKVVNDAGNEGLSGKLSADAIMNPQSSTVTGVDPDQAILNVITGNPSAAVGPTLSSLPLGGHHATGVSVAFRRQMDKELKAATDSLLPETFKKEELGKVLDKATDDAMAQLNNKYNISTTTQPKVTTTSSPDGSASVEIEYVHHPKLKKDGTPDKRYKPVTAVHKETVKLDSNAWGTMDNYAAGDVLGGVLNPASPKLKLRGTGPKGATVDNTVENAGLVTNAQARLNATLNEGFRVAVGAAGSKAGKKRVLKLLSEQDTRGKILSRGEIKAFDPKITNKEIDSYYMQNELFDIADSISKDIKFRQAELNGVKEFSLGDTTLGFGKSYKSLATAVNKAKDDIYGGKVPTQFLDNNTGKYVDAADVDNYLKVNNKQLIVLDKTEVLSSGQSHRMAIVDETDISPLRRDSLDHQRVDGYVTRIRPNAKYFVRETIETIVDGVKVRSKRLRAASSNRADAETAYNEGLVALSKNTDPEVVEIHKVEYDREGTNYDGQDGDSPDRSSGPYLGNRATHDIEWREASGMLENPRMALAKNLAYVAKAVPMNEWKMAQETRWKNSVKAAGITDTPDIRTPLNIKDTTDSEGRLLEETRKYLQGAFGIPDAETAWFENRIIGISEWMDLLPGGDLVGRSIRRNSDYSPINSLKYAAFHSMLGWLNPSQLIVQASNMATAMSIHPWLTTRHMHKAMALRANLYASETGARRMLTKRVGLDGDEMDDMVHQFKRGGYDQIETNADMEAAIGGYGTTRDAFRRATQAGLVLYRQGELAGRTVTYTVARQSYMKDMKIKDWKKLTDHDHKQIRQVFDNLSMNLGRENKANFQTGLVSLPTQFLHVTTKFVEMFIGKKFTMAEKMRLVIGQGAMFGAAGIPMGEALSKGWERMFSNPEDNTSGSPIPSEVVRNGLVSFITGDVNISGRVGLGNQATETLMSIFESTNTPIWQDLMGASGTLLGRGTYAFNIITAFSDDGADVIEEDRLMRAMKATLGMTSSFNNAEQAYMMWKHNEFISKNKNSYNFNNPTWQEILGKGLGFQSNRELETYKMGKASIDYQKWSTKIADLFFQQLFNAGIDARSMEFSEEFNRQLTEFTRIHGGGNEHDIGKLQEAIAERMKTSKSKRVKAFNTILRNQMSGHMNPAHVSEARDYGLGEGN